jgi:hypothetical protein
MTYNKDRAWSDKFIPEIKSIIGSVLITVSSPTEDAIHNTDLIVLTLAPYRIACRIRRHRYISFRSEFTIRTSRPSKKETELAKMLSGWGDYIFYGFSNEDETALSTWIVGDLKVFRIWYCREMYKKSGLPPGKLQKNGDGSSQFTAFPVHIPDFVVAKKNKMSPVQATFF